MNFTLKSFQSLLFSLQKQNFTFKTVEEFINSSSNKSIILRHDVDRLPGNSLKTAQIEKNLQITGSYYFRIVQQSYDASVIKQIAELGHEIRYHYEDLTLTKGDIDKAYDLFCRNLETLRKLYPVKTICMHGSPMSKWDNRLIWQKYDYRKLGLIGEPYFDIDFTKVLYLTDTGRRWDGDDVNLRDKILTKSYLSPQIKIHSTFDLIKAIETEQIPIQVMLTIHPQRWNDRVLPWVKELVWQNVKNGVKRLVVMGS
jgi:hypothetical protein